MNVEYEVPPASYRYPVRTFNRRSRNTWAPGSVLELHDIPLHVDKLMIAGRELPIHLTGAGVQRVDVDLDDLAAPERR